MSWLERVATEEVRAVGQGSEGSGAQVGGRSVEVGGDREGGRMGEATGSWTE